jgi:SAM-dependent MidA family methyltransferase
VPPFLAAVELDLVETSAVLRAKQAERLAMYRPHWHEDIAAVPTGPAIIIGNEFLDALPVRQWVRDGARWRERAVGLAGDRLVFTTLPAAGRPPEVPAAVDEAPNGAIFETRPGLAGLAAAMSERARQAPIAALFIDYGHGAHALGDTLQAVRAHAAADPLAGPGTADLSTQVDFAAVAAEMQARGLLVDGPMLQAEFLGRLGLIERAQRLMAGTDAVTAGRIEAGALRLVDPAGMGSRFKAVGIRSPGLSRLPPF